MRKLFNVTEDMHGMTSDQLKGAIINMELTANALFAVFESYLGVVSDQLHVLGVEFDPKCDRYKTLYLPSIDGVNSVIIRGNDDSALLQWKLEFFAEYGDLPVEYYELKDVFSVRIAAPRTENERTDEGYQKFVKQGTETQRLSAEIYESYSKTKI